MSALALPLYRLTKKSVQWRWDEDCEESYLTFCEALAQNPVVLAFPDWTMPFHLEVDASSDAVGGVLAQDNEQGQVKPLAFFSSALNPAQQKYSVGEREAWAIVAAARKWQKYLHAAVEVVIWTDHNPMVWLRSQRDPEQIPDDIQSPTIEAEDPEAMGENEGRVTVEQQPRPRSGSERFRTAMENGDVRITARTGLDFFERGSDVMSMLITYFSKNPLVS